MLKRHKLSVAIFNIICNVHYCFVFYQFLQLNMLFLVVSSAPVEKAGVNANCVDGTSKALAADTNETPLATVELVEP